MIANLQFPYTHFLHMMLHRDNIFKYSFSAFNMIQKISEKLSLLVNYTEAISFPGFGSNGEVPKGKFYQMSSIGERKAFQYIKDQQVSASFVRYNTRQLIRIYPSATRQDSSNLDPLLPWSAGCHIGKCIFN